MTKPAVLTLVRKNVIEDTITADLDYTASADALQFHDEIKLVNPSGDPCLYPTVQTADDLDYKYQYTEGSRGRQMRVQPMNYEFNVDWIGSEVRRKLHRWQKERAQVYLAPGFGRYSTFAFRPSTLISPDQAGGYTVTATSDTDMLFWDEYDRVFRGPASSATTPLYINTPAGQGLVTMRASQNRMAVSYPASNVEGHGATDAGWEKAGTDSADITLTHNSGGFGHTDCPDSLRVQTSDLATTSRYIDASAQWDSGDGEYQGYTFTGSGLAVVTLWMRGRLPHGGLVTFGQAGGDNDTFTSDGKDMHDWTPVQLAVYSADWTTGLPYLQVLLNAGIVSDSAGLEIGPVMVSQNAGITAQRGYYWAHSTAGATAAQYVYGASYLPPSVGTVTVSVFWPEWYDKAYCNIGLIGTGMFFNINRSSSSTYTINMTASTALTGPVTNLSLGAVNVFSYVYGRGLREIYANGELVVAGNPAGLDLDFTDAADTFRLGNSVTAGSFPCLFLNARFDAEVMTATEIAHLHSQLSDPGALETIIPARGRTFEITKIPSTPISSVDGTQWLGSLGLRQVGYEYTRADSTSKENMIL